MSAWFTAQGPVGEPVDGDLVEVVDETGVVVDVVARQEMRAENLRHRCTYVAVIVVDGVAQTLDSLPRHAELVVHLRAEWKDVFASHWDLAFGGVCGVGESWPVAAVRELAEEAGLTDVVLHELGIANYDGDATSLVGMVYAAVVSTEVADRLESVDGEVEAFERIALGDIDRWVTGRPVCPDGVAIVAPKLLELIN